MSRQGGEVGWRLELWSGDVWSSSYGGGGERMSDVISISTQVT